MTFNSQMLQWFPALGILIGCIAMCIPPALAEAAPGGEARFEIGGHVHTFTEVSAFRVPHRREAGRFQTYVLLTAAPANRAAIMASPDVLMAAMNDPAAAEERLGFLVDDDGKATLYAKVGETQYVDSSGAILGRQGGLAAECAVNSENHIECAINTPRPMDAASGEQWTLHATFRSDVLARQAGEALPAGGGAPGQTLARLDEAFAATDLDEMLGQLSERRAQQFQASWRSPEDNRKALEEWLSRSLPRQATVTAGELSGDGQAMLDVEGRLDAQGDTRWRFRVRMLRHGEGWGFDDAIPSGLAR